MYKVGIGWALVPGRYDCRVPDNALHPPHPTTTVRITVLAVLLAAFGALAWLAPGGHLAGFETGVYATVSGWVSPGLTGVMIAVSGLSAWYVILAVNLVIVLWPRARRAWGWTVAASSIVTPLLNSALKTLIARPRPDVAVLDAASGYSFPSGHAMNSAALVAIITLMVWTSTPRRGPRFGVLAAAVVLTGSVGLSRVYLGVHYAGDVIAGWIAGVAVAWATAWIGAWVRARLAARTVSVPTPATGTQTPGPEIQAVIFDLDGVLTDTAECHFQAWRRLAGELGIPFTRADNEKFRGVSRADCLSLLLEGRPTDDFDALLERKNAYYIAQLSDLTPADIAPGARALIADLKRAGVKTAIGSASKNTGAVLAALGLGDEFDAVVDGTMLSRSKPDPEVFLTAARLVGVPPANCVVIEDAEAGIDAGLAAGMRTIGIGPAERVGHAHAIVPGLDSLDWRGLQALAQAGSGSVSSPPESGPQRLSI